MVDSGRTDHILTFKLPFGWIEQEGSCLIAAQSAVTTDQLLKSGHFIRFGIVEAIN